MIHWLVARMAFVLLLVAAYALGVTMTAQPHITVCQGPSDTHCLWVDGSAHYIK